MVYVAVALLNYSVTQSLLGAAVGNHLSKGTGGIVKVGSMHVSPFSHLILYDVLLVTPEGDTVADGRRIACHFKRFPLSDNTLTLTRVRLDDVYYHLQIYPGNGLNLNYLIRYFSSDKPHQPPTKPFTVEVGELLMNNVHYKQDLKHFPRHFDNGVYIPHMEFFNIGGKIKNIRVVNDHVVCRFVKFHTEEKSGFCLRDLSMDVEVSPQTIRAINMELLTDSTRLLCDAVLDYDSWNTMQYYCDSVAMDLILKPGTEVAMSDVAYWAPVLWGMHTVVTVDGHAYGTVADLHADNFTMAFGERTNAYFDGYINGLPYIQQTSITANVHHLTTNTADINELLMGFHVPQSKLLRRAVANAGEVDLTASLDGSLRDCYATLGMSCGMGNIEADMSVRYDSLCHDYGYFGTVGSTRLNLATVLPNDWLTQSGFVCTLQGVGFNPANMEATVKGSLFDSRVRGLPVHNTSWSAEVSSKVLTAEALLDDTLLHLELAGSMDWSDSVPTFATDLSVKSADMVGLNLWKPTSDTEEVWLSLQMHADLAGRSLDDLSGQVTFDDCTFSKDGEPLSLSSATLTSQPRRGRKNVTLLCDWLTLTLRGYFDYADLPLMVRQFEAHYLPEYYYSHLAADSVDYGAIADATMNVDLVLKDVRKPLLMFLPNVRIAKESSLHGSYNFAESLKLVLRSDSLSVGGITLRNIGLNGGLKGEGYGLDLDADGLTVGQASLLSQFRSSALLHRRVSHLGLRWGEKEGDDSAEGWGDLAFEMLSNATGNTVTVNKHLFSFADDIWSIGSDIPLYFATDTLVANAVHINGNGQSMTLSVCRGAHIGDSLAVDFSHLSLSRLGELLLSGSGMAVDGTLEGHCSLVGLDATPYMNAAITVEECEVNGIPLGNVDLLSDWNADLDRLNLSLLSVMHREAGMLQPLTATGYIGLANSHQAIHFDVALEQLDMAIVAPLLSSFSSQVEGSLGGQIAVGGTLKQPTVEGYLSVADGLLMVDATGVAYSFADTLALTNGKVSLREMKLYDPKGNHAVLSGNVAYLSPATLDLNLHTDNLMVLDNKASGTSYYGTLFAEVDGAVRGAFNDLYVSGSVRTNAGSEVTVPVSDKKTLKSQGFITFVGDESEANDAQVAGATSAHKQDGLHLDVSATVTPDVKVNLPIDFSQMYVKIGATGQGDLRLTMANGTPSLLGDYEILNGTMNLTLLSLFSRSFTIDEGSSIDFQGDLADINFDIKAAYSQRVNLSTLTGVAASSENAQKNILVEDVIALSGRLDSPVLHFDIRLPNADQSVEEEVFAYIDRTNERDMLNQSVSLLLMGKFYNSSATTELTDVGNYASNGYSMVASTVGSVVSSMVQFVDLNVDYKAATSLTTEQLDVDISKEWNKFYFESTFGYGVESSELGIDNTYNLVGDMLVGYKLSPMVHLFVFNRSNTNDYTRVDLPYKQGVGLKFTKDFNNWKDLWRKKQK